MAGGARDSLQVASAGSPGDWTPVPRGGLRVRPGERPSWVELRLTSAEARELRERASGQPLPLDAWLALLTECELTRGRVEALAGGLWAAVVTAARCAAGEARLAPTGELRTWLIQLRSTGNTSRDDLP